MRSDDIYSLPPDLPIPIDDRACDHLPGLPVPPIALASTAGRMVRLDEPFEGTTVVYCYPRTGLPDVDAPAGFDAISGARGCTPQSCAYRDHHQEIRHLGGRIFGLSTQTTDYQQEMAERLHLPFGVLSDENLELARALRLPTFEIAGMTLIRRLTLLIQEGRIVDCFYPVFPSDADAGRVVEWLERRSIGP